MSGSLFYTVKDEHHILPVNWEKWESTGTRTAQGELAGKQEHFARSDAFTVTRNVNVGLLSIFKEKKSSLHSNSCLSCLCICWGSLSQWQQFDVWLLIPVDAGQGSLHQKDQDAALHSNLHLRNKLMCEFGHRDCSRWVHWTKWTWISNYPAGHPKQATESLRKTAVTAHAKTAIKTTRCIFYTQVVWLQIEVF